MFSKFMQSELAQRLTITRPIGVGPAVGLPAVGLAKAWVAVPQLSFEKRHADEPFGRLTSRGISDREGLELVERRRPYIQLHRYAL